MDGPIMSLPDEIIGIIMQNVKCRDILNFGATCKQFNEVVTSNQYIWKEKFREILPNKIAVIVEKHGDGNWLDEIKKFFIVKQKVYEELMTMSPKYYWRTSELTLEDIRNFFHLALGSNVNYHYVTYILQDVVRLGTLSAEPDTFEKLMTETAESRKTNALCRGFSYHRPFTMTDIYYAKIVIRYLTQTYLTLKWAQSYLRNELTPEIVVNFFVQWTDPVTRHPDEDVAACINILVDKVEALFPNDQHTAAKGCYNIKEKLAKGLLNEKQVMEAISEVMYRQHHMTILSGASLHGLDIVKVFHNRCGNLIVTAVVYHAVARNCGVHCELIAFPNHLFLEWRGQAQLTTSYKIDLENGTLVPQGRCPFAPSTFRKEYRYSPEGFLQYVVSAFLMTMGAIKNWYTQNALFLLDFLSNNLSDDNPYRDFLPYLDAMVDFKQVPELNTHMQMEYLPDCQLKILEALSNLNTPPAHFTREVEVKKRDPTVSFAVGMLGYHKKYDYLCVVCGWDLKCATEWSSRRVYSKDLEFGAQQPFYSVIAVDQSERYVAQENLIHVDRPTRLYHLEDVIAKEFSYFDGYCYIPNDEKQKEYPEDEPIRKLYRERAEQKAADLRNAL